MIDDNEWSFYLWTAVMYLTPLVMAYRGICKTRRMMLSIFASWIIFIAPMFFIKAPPRSGSVYALGFALVALPLILITCLLLLAMFVATVLSMCDATRTNTAIGRRGVLPTNTAIGQRPPYGQ